MNGTDKIRWARKLPIGFKESGQEIIGFRQRTPPRAKENRGWRVDLARVLMGRNGQDNTADALAAHRPRRKPCDNFWTGTFCTLSWKCFPSLAYPNPVARATEITWVLLCRRCSGGSRGSPMITARYFHQTRRNLTNVPIRASRD
jgi:hypothetical protein